MFLSWNICSQPFDKLDQFKVFLFDTGLLKQMAGIDNSAIPLKANYCGSLEDNLK